MPPSSGPGKGAKPSKTAGPATGVSSPSYKVHASEATLRLGPQLLQGVPGGSPLKITRLPLNALYIGLFALPPIPGTFSWCLYLHKSAEKGGIRYQITGNSKNWMPIHQMNAGVFDSVSIVVGVRIGQIPEEALDLADGLIKADDGELNKIPGLDSHEVWAGRACERLKANGFLEYPSWEALRAEVLGHGRRLWDSADQNLQPRPTYDSRICRLDQ